MGYLRDYFSSIFTKLGFALVLAEVFWESANLSKHFDLSWGWLAALILLALNGIIFGVKHFQEYYERHNKKRG